MISVVARPGDTCSIATPDSAQSGLHNKRTGGLPHSRATYCWTKASGRRQIARDCDQRRLERRELARRPPDTPTITLLACQLSPSGRHSSAGISIFPSTPAEAGLSPGSFAPASAAGGGMCTPAIAGTMGSLPAALSAPSVGKFPLTSHSLAAPRTPRVVGKKGD